ncbi:MAG: hypothetical protein ABF633_03545 [Clostridium sp.]|uniref:hypothetical protein n=1 Tax=Clostridium sp. TaxID=1506 RepID=UPI0039E8FEB1
MENIIGKKGFKKTGFYAGLIGVISKSDWEGFEHLYKITFKYGGSVLTNIDDIQIVEGGNKNVKC